MKVISKTTILIGITVLIQSCNQLKEVSCQEAAECVRSDSCNIVISEFSKNEYQYYLKGINPITKKESSFKRINYTWAYWFKDKISKGDTVVKKKGELNFYVHRKDTVLIFPFECDGVVFK